MGGTTVEKSAEELQREIDELHRQRREITERLRDPRGLRRGGLSSAAGRNFAASGSRQRGVIRPADRNREDEPPAKRRLSSAVVKVEDGEFTVDGKIAEDVKEKQSTAGESGNSDQCDKRASTQHHGSWSRRDINQRVAKKEAPMPLALPEPVPRVLPKNEDPSLTNRNKRMLGQLLGTLEKFRNEDKQISGTDAYTRRSTSLQRAEQKAREESERLRLQERERIAEKRRRDLTLRARVTAKAEEKKLELLFLQWSEHQNKLCKFIRTKTEPPIYYVPAKPLEEDLSLETEKLKEQAFLEWKGMRRDELNQYQKEIEEQYLGNVEKELERWQNARKARKTDIEVMNLQETMDKELETHRMEHGPKKRKIPGGEEEGEEEEVEDINGGEDEMTMDDVLGERDDGNRRVGVVDDIKTGKAEAATDDTDQPLKDQPPKDHPV